MGEERGKRRGEKRRGENRRGEERAKQLVSQLQGSHSGPSGSGEVSSTSQSMSHLLTDQGMGLTMNISLPTILRDEALIKHYLTVFEILIDTWAIYNYNLVCKDTLWNTF